MSIKLYKLAGLATAAVVSTTLASAAIIGSATAEPSHGGTVHAARHRHKPKHHRHATTIPQHNGGDHDSDNNGGPSDGDGNQ